MGTCQPKKNSVEFSGAFSIGDTDILRLPVKDIGPAIGFYTLVLGFEVLERDEKSAILNRGKAKMGIQINSKDPEQASVYLEVSDAPKLRSEYQAKGISPSPLRTEKHGNKTLDIFFAKEPYGVCFCFGSKCKTISQSRKIASEGG